MHKQFLQSLNQELIQAGVWGRPAEMLKQELYDHYQTEKESLLKQGKSENEAETLALNKLGSPNHLAQTAQEELDRRNGRFLPKLLLHFVILCIFPLIWYLLTLILSWMIFLLFVTLPHHLILESDLQYSLDWIIWSTFLGTGLLAFLWLLRGSFNPVRGWHYLLLTSVYLAFYFIYLNALLLYASSMAFENHPRITWSIIVEVFSYCLLLLLTPWLVRAWKIHQTSRLLKAV